MKKSNENYANEIRGTKHPYDADVLNIIEQRREEYIKSNKKGYTIEQSMDYINRELKKRGL